jgi:hypothetical protein
LSAPVAPPAPEPVPLPDPVPVPVPVPVVAVPVVPVVVPVGVVPVVVVVVVVPVAPVIVPGGPGIGQWFWPAWVFDRRGGIDLRTALVLIEVLAFFDVLVLVRFCVSAPNSSAEPWACSPASSGVEPSSAACVPLAASASGSVDTASIVLLADGSSVAWAP